ncbi:hypothetical protein [Sphingobium boeckii]|uniref:Uncharacterized protein n=1 Tax=Sphingobium boeckii TaxID=1082345 RepID=A0A7W9EDK9_9SPHN|nr:hypothetical protein [Sphingobium boeckii]MBB5685398.1 hypothetical protein [Sphingobium boeckii]
MTRILIALAAIATTTVPLLALNDTMPASAARTPIIIGSDQPILLKRMVVKATYLPED